MAYMCIKGFGECDACGCCRPDWDEDDNEVFHDEDTEDDEEYRPEDDWDEEDF